MKASCRSRAAVAAESEIDSESKLEAAFLLSRLERHCMSDTGASRPWFNQRFVKPSNQPCCERSRPPVSKLLSATMDVAQFLFLNAVDDHLDGACFHTADHGIGCHDVAAAASISKAMCTGVAAGGKNEASSCWHHLAAR